MNNTEVKSEKMSEKICLNRNQDVIIFYMMINSIFQNWNI